MNIPEAYQFLLQLGTTADEIAAALIELGIKGNHGATTCPLSIYLRKHGAGYVSMNGGWMTVDGVRVAIMTPGCRDFIKRFDVYDEWPELLFEPPPEYVI